MGQPNYREQALKECRAYLRLLARRFGEPPPGARFALSRETHDFGSYFEVVVWYDPEDEASHAFACRVEDDLPARWDAQAREELELEIPSSTSSTRSMHD